MVVHQVVTEAGWIFTVWVAAAPMHSSACYMSIVFAVAHQGVRVLLFSVARGSRTSSRTLKSRPGSDTRGSVNLSRSRTVFTDWKGNRWQKLNRTWLVRYNAGGC